MGMAGAPPVLAARLGEPGAISAGLTRCRGPGGCPPTSEFRPRLIVTPPFTTELLAGFARATCSAICSSETIWALRLVEASWPSGTYVYPPSGRPPSCAPRGPSGAQPAYWSATCQLTQAGPQSSP